MARPDGSWIAVGVLAALVACAEERRPQQEPRVERVALDPLPVTNRGPAFWTVVLQDGTWRTHPRDLPRRVGELVLPLRQPVHLTIWSDTAGVLEQPAVRLHAELASDEMQRVTVFGEREATHEVALVGEGGSRSCAAVIRVVDEATFCRDYGGSKHSVTASPGRVGLYGVEFQESQHRAYDELLEYRVWVESEDSEHEVLHCYALREDAEALLDVQGERARMTRLVRHVDEGIVEMPMRKSEGYVSAEKAEALWAEMHARLAASSVVEVRVDTSGFVAQHHESGVETTGELWLPQQQDCTILVKSVDLAGEISIPAFRVERGFDDERTEEIHVHPLRIGDFELEIYTEDGEVLAGTVHVIAKDEFDRRFPK